MNDFSQARDVIGALLIVGAAIALILGISPIHPWFLFVALFLFAAGVGIAKHRLVAVAAAVFVLGARFIFVFALGRDWRMLLGALVCGGFIYFLTKLDPSLLESGDN
jgi:hypothetical protein